MPRRTSSAFGVLSLGLSTLACFAIFRARKAVFVHGEELVWLVAYLIPLVLAFAALILALVHVTRRRFTGIFAWMPTIPALLVLGWLVAYLFFDAFRN